MPKVTVTEQGGEGTVPTDREGQHQLIHTFKHTAWLHRGRGAGCARRAEHRGGPGQVALLGERFPRGVAKRNCCTCSRECHSRRGAEDRNPSSPYCSCRGGGEGGRAGRRGGSCGCSSIGGCCSGPSEGRGMMTLLLLRCGVGDGGSGARAQILCGGDLHAEVGEAAL